MELTLMQKMAISTSDRLEWYRAMSIVSKDGIPVINAVQKMAKAMAKTSHPLVPLLEILLLRQRGGAGVRATEMSFGAALAGMVPEDERMLIEAGEKSGDVGIGLGNAGTMVTAKKALTGSVYSALAKPVGYLVAMILLLVFFSFNLMPKFEATKPRAIWPHSAQLLGSVADHVIVIAVGTVAFLVATFALLQFVLPRWQGEVREWCDRYIFPINIVAAISGAGLLTSVAAYTHAGVPFVTAMENICRTATPYMKGQCMRVATIMKGGRTQEEALCSLSVIPVKFHWIIEVYGMSSDPAAAYSTISAEMVRGVQAYVARLFGLIVGNLMLIGIAGMVLWIYGSMFSISLAGNSMFGG